MPLNHKPTINWGIIAPGHIAHKFASDLKSVANAHLYAVASRDLQKAEAFRLTHQATKAYGSYQELLQDPTVDAVYIANPHAFHQQWSIAAMRAKKAVLCEKPLGLDRHQVASMIAVAKEEQVLFMEALWSFFLPHTSFLQEFIQSNTYGGLQSVEADFGFTPNYNPHSRLFNKSLGGGSLLDIGIYPIFLALITLGIPEKIEAEATFFPTGADSSCQMQFHYPNARKAKLYSTLLEKTLCQASLQFEKGHILIEAPFHKPTQMRFTDEHGRETTKDFRSTTLGYDFEIKHFNQLLREGKTESPLASFNFSRDLIQLLDQVKQTIGLEY